MKYKFTKWYGIYGNTSVKCTRNQTTYQRKSLAISSNQNLELNDDKLVINCNGFISDVLSTSIHFRQSEIDNKSVITFIQSLICEHLNLEPNMVIFVNQNELEFQLYGGLKLREMI